MEPELDAVRHVSFDGKEPPPAASPYCSNYIRTTKYTLITFFPMNLFEQFQKKANFYFLIIAILALTSFSPKRPEVSILPLVFVLTVSAIKEAFEDFSRYQMDVGVNNTKVSRWTGTTWAQVPWQDVQVGNLLKVAENNAFPTDLLLLQSSGLQGMCNIETSNLDGETNLKIKKAIACSCDITANSDASDYPSKLKLTLESSLPNPKMDRNSWEGTISGLSADKEPVGMTQLLLRGCSLRNTKWIVGLVVFTGIETKLMLNSKLSKFKRSSVEYTVDKALYVIFFIQFCLCLFGMIANSIWLKTHYMTHYYLGYVSDSSGITADSILAFMTYLVLLDTLVPISLYVSMELVKFQQAWFINQDLRMYHLESDTPAKARTSNLNEELGQVEYIFSDKTGTLTQNKMEFLRCFVGAIKYGPGEMEAQKEVVNPAPMEQGLPRVNKRFRFLDYRMMKHLDLKNEQSRKLSDFLTLLCVCHTVIAEPALPGNDVVEYQAASPDERALVIAAQCLHHYFYDRQAANINVGSDIIDGQICRCNIRGVNMYFEVLAIMEFNSTRKRMSVVVRDSRDNQIKVFCKGADNIILERLNANSKANDWPEAEIHLREYAQEGLRTLCCAARTLSESEFTAWFAKLKIAKSSMENRDFKVCECGEELEVELELVGCTAIEDRLQDGVPDCIARLAEADIKIWVLTGDKVETAINIGRSAKLLNESMQGEQNLIVIDIDEKLSDSEAKALTLKEIARGLTATTNKADGSNDLGLVISGKALGFMFPARKRNSKGKEILPSDAELADEKLMQLDLLRLCKRCKAVICCRVSPIQKAQVVLLVKENELGKVTLAIGDGANDVPMIKAAHVGIGISGQEGLQAVMSSDYAIAQFRFLKQLLLVHGAWSYRRISMLINYSFYKNMTVSFTQMLFAFYNGYSGQLFFDAFTGSLYNMIFTALPILLVAVFNRDVQQTSLRRFPSLYASGQQNTYFNIPLLLIWLAKGVYHSLIMFFLGVACLMKDPVSSNGFTNDIWTISTQIYLAVLILVTIEVAIVTTTWVNWSFFVIALSLGLWFAWIIAYTALPNIILTADMVGVGIRMLNLWITWCFIPVAIIACVIPELVVEFILIEVFPNRLRLVAELETSPDELEKAIAHWQSPHAIHAKQVSKLNVFDMAVGPNQTIFRAVEHLGFAPFAEDERNQDFVMGQVEFLNRSLHLPDPHDHEHSDDADEISNEHASEISATVRPVA